MKIEQMQFKNPVKFIQKAANRSFVEALTEKLTEHLGKDLSQLTDEQLVEEIGVTLNFSFSSMVTSYLEENYLVVLEENEEANEWQQESFLDQFIDRVVSLNSPLEDELVSQDQEFYELLKGCAQVVKTFWEQTRPVSLTPSHPYGITFKSDEDLQAAMELLAQHGVKFSTDPTVH